MTLFLDKEGLILALAMSVIITYFGGIEALFIILTFLALYVIATKYVTIFEGNILGKEKPIIIASKSISECAVNAPKKTAQGFLCFTASPKITNCVLSTISEMRMKTSDVKNGSNAIP